MGELDADLDVLGSLASTLRGLTDEAGAIRVGAVAGPYASGPGGVPGSVLTAAELSDAVIDGALLPAVLERLSETCEIIGHVVTAYRDRDGAAGTELGAAFTAATGEWV